MFLQARLWALTSNGGLRANQGFLVRLPCKIRANVLNPGLLHIISDCAVDPLDASLAFARAGETGLIVPDCSGWFLYNIAETTIILVSKWQATSLKRCVVLTPPLEPFMEKLIHGMLKNSVTPALTKCFPKRCELVTRQMVPIWKLCLCQSNAPPSKYWASIEREVCFREGMTER